MNPDNRYLNEVHLRYPIQSLGIKHLIWLALVREVQRLADAWEARVALATATAKHKGIVE